MLLSLPTYDMVGRYLGTYYCFFARIVGDGRKKITPKFPEKVKFTSEFFGINSLLMKMFFAHWLRKDLIGITTTMLRQNFIIFFH